MNAPLFVLIMLNSITVLFLLYVVLVFSRLIKQLRKQVESLEARLSHVYWHFNIQDPPSIVKRKY